MTVPATFTASVQGWGHWQRPLLVGLSVLGLLVLAYVVWAGQAIPGGLLGFDARSYWRPELGPNLYAGTASANGFGPYRYSPAFAQLVTPLGALGFGAFAALWSGLEFAALAWMLRRWTLVALIFPPVAAELYEGNIHLLIAAALVLALRGPATRPATWTFLLLTKVTPGIGLLWYAVRREWRALAIVAGTAVAIVAASAVLDWSLWPAWATSLLGTPPAGGPNHIPVPLPVRLVAAGAITIWAARGSHVWALPVAVTLALPTLWFHGLAVLVATPAILMRQGSKAVDLDQPSSKGPERGVMAQS